MLIRGQEASKVVSQLSKTQAYIIRRGKKECCRGRSTEMGVEGTKRNRGEVAFGILQNGGKGPTPCHTRRIHGTERTGPERMAVYRRRFVWVTCTADISMISGSTAEAWTFHLKGVAGSFPTISTPRALSVETPNPGGLGTFSLPNKLSPDRSNLTNLSYRVFPMCEK